LHVAADFDEVAARVYLIECRRRGFDVLAEIDDLYRRALAQGDETQADFLMALAREWGNLPSVEESYQFVAGPTGLYDGGEFAAFLEDHVSLTEEGVEVLADLPSLMDAIFAQVVTGGWSRERAQENIARMAYGASGCAGLMAQDIEVLMIEWQRAVRRGVH
jgi:hypothetical protein